MYPQRMVRQALRLGLVVTLVAWALGACGGGGAKDRAGEAATIKTLAGGWGTHLGDGGLAMAARFCGSNDVALDGSGNLYISDGTYCSGPGGRTVRKVNPDGAITTVAVLPVCLASPAMAGLSPRRDSISPSPWR